MRGSRKPDIQRIVADIKCYERKLDIHIIPVWTPRSQSRIVTADLGFKMASSTDEWCIDREELVTVFTKLNFSPDVKEVKAYRLILLINPLFFHFTLPF
jgi:hypothetical protein